MNKKTQVIEKYMKLPYTMILRRDEDGDVIARVKEFEGCVADGPDEAAALENLRQVMAMWIESRLEASQVIPAPEEEQTLPSGKWLQRVPRSLHRDLIAIAEREGTSLNQLVTSVLAAEAGRREFQQTAIIRAVEAVGHLRGDRWSISAAKAVGWHLVRPSGSSPERIESTFVDQLLGAIPSNPTKLPERQNLRRVTDDKDRKVWAN